MKSDAPGCRTTWPCCAEETARQDSAARGSWARSSGCSGSCSIRSPTTRETIRTLRGDVANDLYGVQQQLAQLQELTASQSQRRLTELRTQLEARAEQLATTTSPGAASSAAPAPADTGATPAGAAPTGGNASADQMYEASLGQLRRGSASTARLGFRELLRSYPRATRCRTPSTSPARAPHRECRLGRRLLRHGGAELSAVRPRSVGPLQSRTPPAGFPEQRGARCLPAGGADHPKSDEAALARDRLKALGR